MSYKALYREWRPQNFQTLVDQKHVSRTLKNALQQGRVAHAYLFTGTRGTGKTSTAKILAKAVNCSSPQEGEPCNECFSCKSINAGSSLDVFEIDAASNRGIEEIRDIKERVTYVPSQGKYKVYIIDEVHMLTTEAFNALLKTLEEPPAHVIFILATTEPQKVPATILSRCQRFDFHKISPLYMKERLDEILEASGFSAEEGVLSLIVKKAEGSLRDAISILDQMLSLGGKVVDKETAYNVLGTVRSEALVVITDALIEKNASQIIMLTNELLQEGIEAGQILRDLLEHLRTLLLLQVCGEETALVIASEEERKKLMVQGKELGVKWLSHSITALAKAESENRWRQNLQIVLETTLLSLIALEEMGEEEKPKIKTKPEKRENNILQGKQEVIDHDIEQIHDHWVKIMSVIKNNKRTLHAFLTECQPLGIRNNQLMLAFKEGYTFHKDKVEEHENKDIVEKAIKKVLGNEYSIVCVLEEEREGRPEQEEGIQKALEVFGKDTVIISD